MGVVTAPLVTESGVLAPKGLDRNSKLVFRIAPMLLKLIPDRVSNEDAQRAYRFLVDDWLCKVLTDKVGKAVAIAAALTLVERVLLEERPAFFCHRRTACRR